MAQTRNIVILGASFGGLGTAHYICKHVLPKLASTPDAKHVLHIVDPSTHFWWHIAAPREIVSVEQAKHEKYFLPIMDGFKQYTTLQDSIVFHHATATSLDTQARTVSLQPHGSESTESLEYHALVVATGIRSPTPLTTLQGDYTLSQRALEAINVQLATAKQIVIGGGGPVGVEIAGEIGAHLKGKGAQITLVTGADRLLPILSAARAAKAHKLLEKVGVTVKYGTRITGTQSASDGARTEVTLSDGTTLSADVYIPASGVTPNTEFLPRELVDAKTGYVAAEASTLRVPAAGERVYVAGDVAGIDKGGVLNMMNSLPVLHANLAHDLFAAAGNVGPAAAEKRYVYKPAETQLVPVGPKTGVAAFNGFGMPGFAVAMIKGKDYMAGEIPKWTQGKAFAKA